VAADLAEDPPARPTARRFTPASEREVRALMAEGRTNLGIAQRLYLSERNVETHVARSTPSWSSPTTKQITDLSSPSSRT
jgi:DNA-binding NarL/FixJ family response regulator